MRSERRVDVKSPSPGLTLAAIVARHGSLPAGHWQRAPAASQHRQVIIADTGWLTTMRARYAAIVARSLRRSCRCQSGGWYSSVGSMFQSAEDLATTELLETSAELARGARQRVDPMCSGVESRGYARLRDSARRHGCGHHRDSARRDCVRLPDSGRRQDGFVVS